MIYTALRAAMIYQACGLDKKFDKSTLVVRKDSFARIRYISQEICRILAFLVFTRFYGFLPSIQ
ncbi:MAG: hypothetical protein J6D87_05660, partial [Clostridia bacterium]|nr:hypothetical protein [Clostridia bacterium]